MSKLSITFEPRFNINQCMMHKTSSWRRADYFVFVDGAIQNHAATSISSESRTTLEGSAEPIAFYATVNGDTERFRVQGLTIYTPKEERKKAIEDALSAAKAHIVNSLNGSTIP